MTSLFNGKQSTQTLENKGPHKLLFLRHGRLMEKRGMITRTMEEIILIDFVVFMKVMSHYIKRETINFGDIVICVGSTSHWLCHVPSWITFQTEMDGLLRQEWIHWETRKKGGCFLLSIHFSILGFWETFQTTMIHWLKKRWIHDLACEHEGRSECDQRATMWMDHF